MTEIEYDLFQKKLQKSKLSQTDFFLSLLDKKKIIVIEDLRPILSELKKQGTNLNQIARYLNTNGYIEESNSKIVLDECLKFYRNLYRNLYSLVEDITNATI